jgi:hypothetical protein
MAMAMLSTSLPAMGMYLALSMGVSSPLLATRTDAILYASHLKLLVWSWCELFLSTETTILKSCIGWRVAS